MSSGGKNVELTANIHREDGSYWADVPDLPGCFASGDTLDELFSSLTEGVRLYLTDESNNALGSTLHVKTAVLSDAVSA